MTKVKANTGEDESSSDMFGEFLPLSNAQRKMVNAITAITAEPSDDINYTNYV